MPDKTIEQNFSQGFACDGKQGDSTMVVTSLTISFVFVKMHNRSIFEIL